MFPQKCLTSAEIESLPLKLKPYKISVGKALYLKIMPNGAKYWRLKYRFEGREKKLALGVYPDVSLQQAEKSRDEAKR